MVKPRPLKKLPGKPGDPVDAQDLVSTVIENYTTSNLNSAQLESLQGWVKAQRKASTTK
jgi:hypothetical protein